MSRTHPRGQRIVGVSLRLSDRPWPEVPEKPLLIVPLGSTEQHGPHLPFSVDADVAAAVAEAAGRRLGAVIAPVLAYGSSGEHGDFPGTLSIGQDALRIVVIELVRSATWARRVAFVNGHGGNLRPLAAAVRQMRAEKHDVAWVPCAMEMIDPHAGRAETSLMLALRPVAVGNERPAGPSAPIGSLLPQLQSRGVRAVSPNGVLGDAGGASAAEGHALLGSLTTLTLERILSWTPDANGMLADGG